MTGALKVVICDFSDVIFRVRAPSVLVTSQVPVVDLAAPQQARSWLKEGCQCRIRGIA
jgi:hypothetical protein